MTISILQQECSLQNETFTKIALEEASQTYRPYADWHGSESCTGGPLAPFYYTTCSDSASALWGAMHCTECGVRRNPNTGALQRRVPSSLANGINFVSDGLLCLGTTITAVATTMLCGGGALACALPWMVGTNTVSLIARPICICGAEKLLEEVVVDNATQKHEKTIGKIHDAIKQISFLNRASPVPIANLFSHLKNVSLTDPTRRSFTEKMSVVQLNEALQGFERSSFDQRYVPFLPEVKKYALMFLQKNTITECDAGELEQLQDLLAQDALLFTYVVQTLPEGAFNTPSIQGVLTKAQQCHTNQEISKMPLKQIRTEAQAEVTFHLQSETQKRQVKVSKSTLLQYARFNTPLTSGFKETQTQSITLELPDYEFDVFDALVTYMKTKTIQTSDVFALLFLADRLQIHDCVTACTYKLIEHFESEAPEYPTLSQCIQLYCRMHKHLFEDLVCALLLRLDPTCRVPSRHTLLGLATTNDFSQCLQKFDQDLSLKKLSLNSMLMKTAFDFYLPLTQAKFISLVEGAIQLNYADFQYLLFFRAYPTYYPTVVEKYLKHLPLSHVGQCLVFSRAHHLSPLEQALILHLQKNISSQNFTCIWEVAETHKLEEVKNTCRDFFYALPNKREITDKWPPIDCPFELFATSFASLDLSQTVNDDFLNNVRPAL